MHTLGHLGDGLRYVVVVQVLLVIEVRRRVQRLALWKRNAPSLAEIPADRILNKPVEINGHHRLGTCGHRCRTHGILVGRMVVGGVLLVFQVLKAVAKPAAAGQRVRAVGYIAEETVSLGPHL